MDSQTLLPILYTFRRCPYAIRARMALRYARQRVEIREVLLSDKPVALLEASAKATVPVLVFPQKIVLDESLEIMQWAISQRDDDGWFSVLVDEQMALIERNDHWFKPLLDGYKYSGKHPTFTSEQCRDQALQQFLTPLDKQLRTQSHLFGSDLQLADVAVFPFIRQFDDVQHDVLSAKDFPGLRIWLDTFRDSVLFRSVMNNYPQWREGAAPITF